MACCPLCNSTIATYGISLQAEFTMCSNEDCIYPFNDSQLSKEALAEKFSKKTGCKTLRTTGAPKRKLNSSIDGTNVKAKKAKPTTSLTSTPPIPKVVTPVQTASRSAGDIRTSTETLAALPDQLPLASFLPQEPVPDLDFDISSVDLDLDSWITPVTPPDTDLRANSGVMKPTALHADVTASSLESLLFNDTFDFGNYGDLDTIDIDPAFEALLGQQTQA